MTVELPVPLPHALALCVSESVVLPVGEGVSVPLCLPEPVDDALALRPPLAVEAAVPVTVPDCVNVALKVPLRVCVTEAVVLALELNDAVAQAL